MSYLKKILKLSGILYFILAMLVSIRTPYKEIICNNKIIQDNNIVGDKVNKSNNFLDKLTKDISLDKIQDDFGGVIFSGVFENTSNLYIRKLALKVEYKDQSGKIVYDDYLLIKDCSPGKKKEIKLRPYENKIVNVELVTDWYEVQ
ncbi:MAG: hypothetical protein ACRDA3_02730 [Peptostreptococcaceae bacterium]